MLRITVHDNAESLTFQLEGRLAGPWVPEAEECRQRTLAVRPRPAVQFDLAGLTFIDDSGKAYLAAMHRLGAKFVAADCLTRAVVAEITKAALRPPAPSPVEGGQGGGRGAKAKARRK
jgi:hypothetical protein